MLMSPSQAVVRAASCRKASLRSVTVGRLAVTTPVARSSDRLQHVELELEHGAGRGQVVLTGAVRRRRGFYRRDGHRNSAIQKRPTSSMPRPMPLTSRLTVVHAAGET